MASASGLEDEFQNLSLNDDSRNDDDELECHFKWKPDKTRNKLKIQELESKLLRDLSENPSVKIQSYSLLGYILTLDPDTYDPEKSKEYFEKALEEAGDAEDKRFVAEANLLMHGIESGNASGFEGEKKKMQEKWSKWARDEPHKLAFTYGCHAIALSKFGPNTIEKAVIQYGKAMDLDPYNWNWPFGKALMLERNRSLNTREVKPSTEILELFERAIDLSDSNEYTIAFYANCLIASYLLTYTSRFDSRQGAMGKRQRQRRYTRRKLVFDPDPSRVSAESGSLGWGEGTGGGRRNKGRGRGARTSGRLESGKGPLTPNANLLGKNANQLDDNNHDQFIEEKQCLEQKIKTLLNKAKEKASETNNITVLKRCCKGFKDMNWYPGLKDCCEKILTIPFKDDTGVLHQVAQYYMRPPLKEYPKARGILIRCIASAPHGNLFAAFDLLKVKLFLKERLNIDSEYEKLLIKYKTVRTDIAIIHENWAKSLQKVERTRVTDIMYHHKEAIRHFDPTVVQNKYSWSQFESKNIAVMQHPKNRRHIKYQDACRNLGWMYFVPEPKTDKNLKSAYEYLSHLKENELEQEDIELYGNVLYELKKYENALKLYEKLEESHDRKSFYKAVCFFRLGKQQSRAHDLQNSGEEQVAMFIKSIQNGCLEGCEALLSVLDRRNIHLQYQYCGYIKICLEDTKRFSLEGPVEYKSHSIIQKMEEILGLADEPHLDGHQELRVSFLEIRKLVLNICTNQVKTDITSSALLLGNGKDTLTKSRSILDHLHNNLQRKLCPTSTDKVYFPLITDKQRPKNVHPGSQGSKDWALECITKKFKNDFGDKDGSKGVADKCKDLIEFIALHQPYTDPERYDWLYDAWDVVNVIKHQKNITEIEWTNPGNGHIVNLVELAQKTAFYAEEMMQEYCKLY